ncbi:class I SAM-dependent methyltransferase [Syntrophomonas palmitatica]|uniref:class I SAM-dependent methyltransferase n=1 Tax=Syntrophomonas palmitatica TaxID=402877 RepID=UPI0006CF391A|nr:class I SAM-dependent methyltransferase [Syntrophomonas palmitatica]
MSNIINLDYSFCSQPRYGYGKPRHQKLNEILNRSRQVYIKYMSLFMQYSELFIKIPQNLPESDPGPRWQNEWISGFDLISLCGFLLTSSPHRYVEIGSGNTTKFARAAIDFGGLNTNITSIDPHPRSEIDALCDNVIREPLETLDVNVFKILQAGDILFVDGSHRVFMNSDVSVVFLDIMPDLPSGVLLHFHDIFLPCDYPPGWAERYYSEQYLLAVHLLAEGDSFEILLPNFFISEDEELKQVLNPLWSQLPHVSRHGASFWLRKK